MPLNTRKCICETIFGVTEKLTLQKVSVWHIGSENGVCGYPPSWFTADHTRNIIIHKPKMYSILQDYVLGKSDRPLILHGASGCGKTSLMAKAASQVCVLEITHCHL